MTDQISYLLVHEETGETMVASLSEILHEINRDRFYTWQDYNKTDWEEGLQEFTDWKIVKG
jgi:hypothetical protein